MLTSIYSKCSFAIIVVISLSISSCHFIYAADSNSIKITARAGGTTFQNNGNMAITVDDLPVMFEINLASSSSATLNCQLIFLGNSGNEVVKQINSCLDQSSEGTAVFG